MMKRSLLKKLSWKIKGNDFTESDDLIEVETTRFEINHPQDESNTEIEYQNNDLNDYQLTRDICRRNRLPSIRINVNDFFYTELESNNFEPATLKRLSIVKILNSGGSHERRNRFLD